MTARELRPELTPTQRLSSSSFFSFGSTVLLFGGLNVYIFRALPVIVVTAVFGCWFFGSSGNALTSTKNGY